MTYLRTKVWLSCHHEHWALTNHNDKGADDDIAAANELLEASRVDLTIEDLTSKPIKNQSMGTDADW